MLEKTKKISIGKKTFIVKFPNVGQIIDLESLKVALSGNRYGQMVATGVRNVYMALDMIDTIAFFQTVAPEVGQYYDIKDYASLDVERMQQFVDVYVKQIRPWFEGTLNAIQTATLKPTEDEKSDDVQ